MKERILLVGEDSLLLETRSLILADWQTEKSTSVDVMRHVKAQSFELVILGHTVPLITARAIIARLNELERPPAILAIRPPHESGDLDVYVRVSDLHESPGWLKDEVTKILRERRAVDEAFRQVTPFPPTWFPGVGRAN